MPRRCSKPTSVTSAVTCTAATPEPTNHHAWFVGHLHGWLRPSGVTCWMPIQAEVMICWCYPLHLFVWRRRDSWPVLLTPISRHCRQVPSQLGLRRLLVVPWTTPSRRRIHQNPSTPWPKNIGCKKHWILVNWCNTIWKIRTEIHRQVLEINRNRTEFS